MCLTSDRATDARRLAERAATMTRWIVEDLDADNVGCAETNLDAAITALVEAREMLGALAGGQARMARLLGA